MKIEKIISDGKLKNMLDGEINNLEISKIKSIRYKLYTRPWFNQFLICTDKEDNIWGPFLLPWDYIKVAAEIKKINPKVEDGGIDYSIIGLALIFFVISFLFFGTIRLLGFI